MSLDDYLTKLKWRRVDLARRLGLAPETISRWNHPPDYVVAYLNAMLTLKNIRDMINRQIGSSRSEVE